MTASIQRVVIELTDANTYTWNLKKKKKFMKNLVAGWE